MQLKLLSKKRMILWIVLGILVTNILTYYGVKNILNTNRSSNRYRYAVTFGVDFSENTQKYMFKPIIENPYGDQLIDKVNTSLTETFINWLPENAKSPELSYASATLSSSDYLSINIIYTFYGRRIYNTDICSTINMKTGEVVYLDDLIEVDEELEKIILTEGVLKIPYSRLTGEIDVNRSKLNEYETEELPENLRICSEPFNESNWRYKPTFYLREGRLYLVNVAAFQSTCFIELDAIKHKLKVDMW